jgi:hypothetical protein
LKPQEGGGDTRENLEEAGWWRAWKRVDIGGGDVVAFPVEVRGERTKVEVASESPMSRQSECILTVRLAHVLVVIRSMRGLYRKALWDALSL